MDNETRRKAEQALNNIKRRDPEEILEEVKAERKRIEDQLRQEDPARFLDRDGKGRGYICPVCGSGGNGNHNTGIQRKIKNGVPRYKCHASKCIEWGDIFELIGIKYGIHDFAGQVQKAADIYGYTLPTGADYKERKVEYVKTELREEEGEAKVEEPKEVFNTGEPIDVSNVEVDMKPAPVPAAPKDYMDWYKECMARVGQTDYWQRRGIGIDRPEIISNFWLGYDPAYKSGNNNYKNDVVVIPTSRTTYVCRNTKPGTDVRFFKAPGVSPVLFNTKALRRTDVPLIVTEAEIDALSIAEVGGNALGLGGIGNADLFVELIKKEQPRQLIVLALDNDDAGNNTALHIMEELKDEPVKLYNRDKFTNGIYMEYKDANEMLVKARPFLKAAIQEIMEAEEREAEAAAEEFRDKFSTAAHMEDFMDRIVDSVNTPAIPTGYEKFDEKLDGGLYPGLYILGALSSLGKTTFALQLADQIAANGHDVIIFSLEMARSELIAKSISRMTYKKTVEEGRETKLAKTVHGITDFARYEHYSDAETSLIERSIDSYKKIARHIFIVEAQSKEVGDVSVQIVREYVENVMKNTRRRPVVIVDYLQIMQPAEIRADVRVNTDTNVKGLKRTSRDLNIPIIAISSINRDNYKNEMNMSSFKESGGIEYGADILLGLQLKGAGKIDFDVDAAKAKDPREIELKIIKNRNGAANVKIQYEYFPKFNYIHERDATALELREDWEEV